MRDVRSSLCKINRHKLMFTFSWLFSHLGGELSDSGLQNEWVAQGLLMDRSRSLTWVTALQMCALVHAGVPACCRDAIQSCGACYSVSTEQETWKCQVLFPKAPPNVRTWFSPRLNACTGKINKQEMLTCIWSALWGLEGACWCMWGELMWANSSRVLQQVQWGSRRRWARSRWMVSVVASMDEQMGGETDD